MENQKVDQTKGADQMGGELFSEFISILLYPTGIPVYPGYLGRAH